MKKLLKEKAVMDLIVDCNKYDYYLNYLNKEKTNYLNDAIDFSNKKYAEFCIKDFEVALMNTNPIPTNLDNVSQVIQNLTALKKMIGEIIKKNNQ